MMEIVHVLSAWWHAHFSAGVLSPHDLNSPKQLPGAIYQKVFTQKSF